MSITVRPLEAGDKPEWLGLWRGYVEFYQAEVPETVTETTFKRLIDNAEPMIGLVAMDDDGRVQGIVNCVFHRNTWTDKDVCYLEDLYVCPTTRGKGVGTALIQGVEAMARDKGCFRVYWMTHDHNADARALYDKIGQTTRWVRYDMPLNA